jgi:DNA-cytosine methyltransferase
MNVLSLFDGISCARVALDNLNIKVTNYFSSEIDSHCIKASSNNFPEIVQLGDIREINVSTLPKIDLLIGGSPCQDLSNAQKGNGLKGKKSRLFYEYLRIYNELNPTFFLLENVKNKWGNEMSRYLKTPYIEINSGLFSAQSRPRYYWSNIDVSNIPNNSHKTSIKNILEDSPDEKYYLTKNKIEDQLHKLIPNVKPSKDGLIKAFTLPKEIINDNERQRRIFSIEGKSPTLLARADTTKILINNRVRKLTPLECERLQGLPDNYTSALSDTQRYKSIGNGFTVPVIEFFLKNLKKKPQKKPYFIQEKLFQNEIH